MLTSIKKRYEYDDDNDWPKYVRLYFVTGFFPLPSEYCLVWMCLDVLFCTASIMHLCTISVDRFLSLRYPMRFGRNKTRKRVVLKIIFVWLLSVAMSLPLSLMYSKVSQYFIYLYINIIPMFNQWHVINIYIYCKLNKLI
jgi:hypothetical protein